MSPLEDAALVFSATMVGYGLARLIRFFWPGKAESKAGDMDAREYMELVAKARAINVRIPATAYVFDADGERVYTPSRVTKTEDPS